MERGQGRHVGCDSRVPRRSRILGDQKKAEGAGLTPVLCLHGGPGLGFKYMDGLEVLASEKREVASYDQIGCARSPYKIAKPKPNGTYTPALFADELAEVRRATGLGRVHVVAHGWGDARAGPSSAATAWTKRPEDRRAAAARLRVVAHPRLCSPSCARLIADRREALGRCPASTRRCSSTATRAARGRWPVGRRSETVRAGFGRVDAAIRQQESRGACTGG